MLMNIKSAHFHAGGTAITDFDVERLPIYEEAIRRHGDHRYVVSQHPLNGQYAVPWPMHSLHYIGLPFPGDCGPFWRVWDQVQAEAVEAKRLAEKQAEQQKYDAALKAAVEKACTERLITLTLTVPQAEALMTVVYCGVTGGVSGPRGHIDGICDMLTDADVGRVRHHKTEGVMHFAAVERPA